ncbi:MAG: CvpA family protein [Bacilli bacterium]
MGIIFDAAGLKIDWNSADTIVICALAVFMLIGLIFGAKKVAARIVGQFVAVVASLALANVILKNVAPMDWYQNVIKTLWNNAILVNWVFYVLFSGVIYAVLFLLWRLVFNHLIDDLKDSPILSRIFGMVLGACDWAIILFVIVFFLTMLPSWFGASTPEWITNAYNTLQTSAISNKLVELFDSLINLLGANAHP